jgi:hypothetical protein
VKYLISFVVVLVCAVAVLRHEVYAPASPSLHSSTAREQRTGATSYLQRAVVEHSATAASTTGPVEEPARSVATPLGGMRAWSPNSAPTDGPDPFASIVEVRTEDDIRSGLAEEASR